MEPTYDRILKELEFLVDSNYFQLKEKQREFLEYFRHAYRKQRKLRPITVSELRKHLYEDKEACDNDVSVHLCKLTKHLEEIYRTAEGKRRTGIRLKRVGRGIYLLALESRHGETVIEHVECPSPPPVAACDSEVSGESEKGRTPNSLGQSVNEILLFTKEMDVQGASRIKLIASGGLWSSVLLGLPTLILLLIGLPYWPNEPLQGFGLTAMLLACTCVAILAKPLTRLPGVSFGRWCGEIFYVYRQGALKLVRYSGTCIVDGCGGSLSLKDERETMANLMCTSERQWVLTCKNVPTEHPRTPFYFRARDRVQNPNGSSERELARTA